MINDELHIIHSARRGDQDAFARLVEAYQGPVYRLILRMGLPAAGAEEAAQEAFLAAWRGLPQFRGAAQFSTWLYRLAANAAVDWLRREKRHAGAEDIEAADRPDDSPSPQEQVEQRERRDAIRASLLTLPPDYREILLLRYMQELSYEEIAAALHLPEGTVKSRISRAKAQLRASLQQQGNFFGGDAVQYAGKEERP